MKGKAKNDSHMRFKDSKKEKKRREKRGGKKVLHSIFITYNIQLFYFNIIGFQQLFLGVLFIIFNRFWDRMHRKLLRTSYQRLNYTFLMMLVQYMLRLFNCVYNSIECPQMFFIYFSCFHVFLLIFLAFFHIFSVSLNKYT